MQQKDLRTLFPNTALRIWGIMRKLKNLLRQPEFHAFLFCIYLILICMPFLAFPAKNQAVNMFEFDMFIYFFVVWGMVVAVLFLIAKSLKAESRATPDTSQNSYGEHRDV